MAQGIMGVEILVPQGQGVDPLRGEIAHVLLDAVRIAVIDELFAQARADPGLRLEFAPR